MIDHTVTILLVDDDKVDTMAVRRSFRELNITNPMVAARNGIEALEHLRGENGHEKVPSPCLVLPPAPRQSTAAPAIRSNAFHQPQESPHIATWQATCHHGVPSRSSFA